MAWPLPYLRQWLWPSIYVHEAVALAMHRGTPGCYPGHAIRYIQYSRGASHAGTNRSGPEKKIHDAVTPAIKSRYGRGHAIHSGHLSVALSNNTATCGSGPGHACRFMHMGIKMKVTSADKIRFPCFRHRYGTVPPGVPHHPRLLLLPGGQRGVRTRVLRGVMLDDSAE